MSAQMLVMVLNGCYLVMMGLVSFTGTAALVELLIALRREKPRQETWKALEPEDA